MVLVTDHFFPASVARSLTLLGRWKVWSVAIQAIRVANEEQLRQVFTVTVMSLEEWFGIGAHLGAKLTRPCPQQVYLSLASLLPMSIILSCHAITNSWTQFALSAPPFATTITVLQHLQLIWQRSKGSKGVICCQRVSIMTHPRLVTTYWLALIQCRYTNGLRSQILPTGYW